MSVYAEQVANISDLTRSRALELLGMGVIATQVAAALGVDISRISQLLSEEAFAAKVAELRFSNLRKHTERDTKYDGLEDTLIEKLGDCLPLMHRPMEILKAIQVINSAKRRGASAPEHITNQNQIIQLNVPSALIEKFRVNINNQVTIAGNQSLETIQPGSLLDMAKSSKNLQSNSLTDLEVQNGKLPEKIIENL
jgi:hypothetical protein